MVTILLVALVGTALASLLGTLWYSPSTPMGRVHMQYLGFDKLSKEEQEKLIAESKPKMPKIYSAQMILSFLTSFAVAAIVTLSLQNGVSLGTALLFPLFNWLCFMVPVIGSNLLWGNTDAKLAWPRFFSESGYHLVMIFIVAGIAGFLA